MKIANLCVLRTAREMPPETQAVRNKLMKKHKIAIIIFFVFWSIYPYQMPTFASDSLKYFLCPDLISDAWLKSENGNHYVHIQLTPQATDDFSKITEKNIGRRLEVLYNTEVVLSAKIMARINSGSMIISAMSENKAHNLIKCILDKDPKRPCDTTCK